MTFLEASVLAIQSVCLIVGLVQGIRHFHIEPLTKSFPWLLVTIIGGLLFRILQ